MEKKNDFKPFISADKVLPEFTVTSVILGMILAVIFGGANAYLGLRGWYDVYQPPFQRQLFPWV
mgnify:CR=1 FL=1